MPKTLIRSGSPGSRCPAHRRPRLMSRRIRRARWRSPQAATNRRQRSACHFSSGSAPSRPVLPSKNHVGAEHQVLVERVGDFSRPVDNSLSPSSVSFEVALQRLYSGRSRQAGRSPMIRKASTSGEKGELSGRSGRRVVEDRLKKGVGKGIVAVGPDPAAPGQFHGKPALHPSALDDDDLAGPGARAGARQPPGQADRQVFPGGCWSRRSTPACQPCLTRLRSRGRPSQAASRTIRQSSYRVLPGCRKWGRR